MVVKPTDPSVTPTCASSTEPCVAAAQPTHQKVAGPYPCLFLAALLCGEGTWLFSALPCGGSGLGRGQPRAPPVWGTASTSVLVEISHSAFTAIAAAASSPEVPPWVLPFSEAAAGRSAFLKPLRASKNAATAWSARWGNGVDGAGGRLRRLRSGGVGLVGAAQAHLALSQMCVDVAMWICSHF